MNLSFAKFFLVFLVQVQLFAADLKPTLISLGPDCQVAMMLKHFNLRDEAYPFDWSLAHDIRGATKAIQNNFEHWTDSDFLTIRNSCVYNVLYNIHFNHDFPSENQSSPNEDGDFNGVGLQKIDFLNIYRKSKKNMNDELIDLLIYYKLLAL